VETPVTPGQNQHKAGSVAGGANQKGHEILQAIRRAQSANLRIQFAKPLVVSLPNTTQHLYRCGPKPLSHGKFSFQFSVFSFQFSVFSFQNVEISPLSLRLILGSQSSLLLKRRGFTDRLRYSLLLSNRFCEQGTTKLVETELSDRRGRQRRRIRD